MTGEKTCLDGSPYDDGTRCAAPGGLAMPPAEEGEEEEEAAAAAEVVWKDNWRGPQRSELEAPPYKYPAPIQADVAAGTVEPYALGGTRCPDTDICVKVPKRNESNPLASPFGFACCPRSGYLPRGVTGEAWHLYMPEDFANESTGDLNYTCSWKFGDAFENAMALEPSGPIGTRGPVLATMAQSATLASGCIHNNTAQSEISLDDCVMKTCRTVCNDVYRKCPYKIDFGCPEPDDFREYEDTMCNIAVPQGCLLKVESPIDLSVHCVDLNPTGMQEQSKSSKAAVVKQ